jgi:hypothetical protein
MDENLRYAQSAYDLISGSYIRFMNLLRQSTFTTLLHKSHTMILQMLVN